MPNTGRPSRDCNSCRKRRIKVREIEVYLLNTHRSNIDYSVILNIQSAANACENDGHARAIEKTAMCSFEQKP